MSIPIMNSLILKRYNLALGGDYYNRFQVKFRINTEFKIKPASEKLTTIEQYIKTVSSVNKYVAKLKHALKLHSKGYDPFSVY